MKNLDEMIKHCEEVAEENEKNAKSYPRPDKSVKGSGRKYNACIKCAAEHRQLAEWLKKLQAYEKAREEIIRRKYSDQWSKTVVIHIIDKHLKEVNVDEDSD